MATRPIIEVRDLGKRYQLGSIGASTLRESLAQAWERRFGRQAPERESPGSFWALQHLSFSVEAGEVLGIIGRNGAGKSTLLKILSRITEPTEGEAVLRGRTGSLLEVGTGFHPELTGRENVYLNGAILGMRRREVSAKLGAITAFAGVEAFMDTPVKRYSSGMRVRLAFAVAAHLDPEILIVDEVLAVGDADFQRRCLGKMGEIARSGRTVLFVSHNMASIQSFCERVLVLDGGRKTHDGQTGPGIEHYYRSFSGAECEGAYQRTGPAPDDKPAWITRARLTNNEEDPVTEAVAGAPLVFEVEIQADLPLPGLHLGIGLENSRGVRVCTLHTKCDPTLHLNRARGRHLLRCIPDQVALSGGLYHVRVQLESGDEIVELLECAFTFRILAGDFFANGGKGLAGAVLVRQRWSAQPVAAANHPEDTFESSHADELLPCR